MAVASDYKIKKSLHFLSVLRVFECLIIIDFSRFIVNEANRTSSTYETSEPTKNKTKSRVSLTITEQNGLRYDGSQFRNTRA